MHKIDLNADYPPKFIDPDQRSLAVILAQLIARIEFAGDEAWHQTTLRHGLMIEIGLIAGQFCLRLSRPNVAPSLNEWCTVVARLPAAYKPAIAIEPRRSALSGRQCLDAHWDYQRRLL